MASKTDAWTLYTVWSLFGLPPLSRKGGTAAIFRMVGAHLEAVSIKLNEEEARLESALASRTNTVDDHRRWTRCAVTSRECSDAARRFMLDYWAWLGKEEAKESGRHDETAN